TGDFNIYGPSLKMASYIVDNEPWKAPSLDYRVFVWIPAALNRWILLPLITAVVLVVDAVISFSRQRKLSTGSFASLTLFGSMVIVVVISEIANRSVIMRSEFFTYFYSGMYLALGTVVGSLLTAWKSRGMRLVVVGLFAVGLMAAYDSWKFVPALV